MAEISVIVPVYKAEKYLSQSIESILNQSYSDFELILVDDGSPDNCLAICRDYAQKDPRITVLHQENQGQAAARNHGLDIAKAPWICFVDSDDLIHPQTLERLHRAAQNSGAGISICRMLEAAKLPEDFFEAKDGAYQVYSMDDETMAAMYDRGTYPAWVSCGRLIRRELIETHRFCPGRVYEDNEAVCHWVVAAGKIAEVPQELYFYRTNPDSTTQKEFSLKKLDFLWALEQIIHYYGTVGYEKTRQRFFDRYVLETAYCWRMVHNALGKPREARALKKNLRTLLKVEGFHLTKAQQEYLLDAMHPKLIRIYWPLEGIVRTIREEGLRGITRKLRKHLRGE